MPAFSLGLMGLGVMGANLARNLADHGTALTLYDPTPGLAQRLADDLGPPARAVDSPAALAAALAPSRTVFLLVPAGKPVDEALAALLPALAAGDAVIDGGNSFYRDTQRRIETAKARGVEFMGFGVSGGAEGARRGPAIMAGGSAAAVARMAPAFAAIAAVTPAGEACFARVGEGPAGHFVKAVHNGIEYAHMQLIAESWQMLRRMLGLQHEQARATFARWAHGELSSFLMETAVRVLDTRDVDDGSPMIERIVDTAEQKGTGQWTANAALAYGVAAPTLAEAVHARCLSALKELREAAEDSLGSPTMTFRGDASMVVEALGPALLAAQVAVLAQGFAVIRAADAEHGWGVDPAVVARVWRAGCIVRSTLLEPIVAAYERAPELPNLLFDPELWRRVEAGDAAWRQVVVMAVSHGLPAPAFSSALAYVDGLRTARLWADMIAAQRDVFGQHGFARFDKPGRQHADWAPYRREPAR
jgi:6-phosphogluconate dehydrogenase